MITAQKLVGSSVVANVAGQRNDFAWIQVNPMGIIELPNRHDWGFDDEYPTRQEFPQWPCQTGSEYKVRFKHFINAVNIPLESSDLPVFRRKLEDKIIALSKSSYANLLAGPCLPIIQPQISFVYYENMLNFCWQQLNEVARNKINRLPGALSVADGILEPSFPLPKETFSVRLIFPQALPPMSIAEMDNFSRSLRAQHYISLAGPLDMLCAMLTFPHVFRGDFRFFFPDFFVKNKDIGKLTPCFSYDRTTLFFESLKTIKPQVFDFCPIIF